MTKSEHMPVYKDGIPLTADVFAMQSLFIQVQDAILYLLLILVIFP